jgi:hypothetical protein
MTTTTEIEALPTATEAALCCMIISNPGGGERPHAWQKRVNDLIRAQRDALTALQAERDEARLFLDNAISKAPEPLVDLGKWLAAKLDDDDWPTAERYLNAAIAALDQIKAERDAAEAAEAAEGRYVALRQWFLNELPRSEIAPFGHIQHTTPEVVDQWCDKARAALDQIKGA